MSVNTVAAPDIGQVLDWLIDGARTVHAPQDVLQELCDRLAARGLPLYRVTVFVTSLHPDVAGRGFLWLPGKSVEIAEIDFGVFETDEYLGNPLPTVRRTGMPLRRRLADPACPMDYRLLHELRDDGVTDYRIAPLRFIYDDVQFVSWTTRQPGGFTEPQIAALESVEGPLSRVAEIYALRRTATNLLDTYVGYNAGERILKGAIRRGDIESIHAAVWLADLRGFTALADTLPGDELIEILNAYFDCLVPAIEAHGGEVLKFMGDGLLAIFPIAGDRDEAAVSADAIAAVAEARAAVARLNEARRECGQSDLRFGIALHIGHVHYGNIGGANRLDFTAIGPAVNLAARLEALAGRIGRTVVLSFEVARFRGRDVVALGQFELKGFRDAQEVFGLVEETGGPSEC